MCPLIASKVGSAETTHTSATCSLIIPPACNMPPAINMSSNCSAYWLKYHNYYIVHSCQLTHL